MKGRSKEARDRQAQRERLARMRRKERYQVAYRPERGFSEKGRWVVVFPGGWFAWDNLNPNEALGPFKTEKLARVALNRMKRKEEHD